MELIIGSNIIKNTNGILTVNGKKQIHLEIGRNDMQLLLTMDIYDKSGKHVAKLRRNAWAFNDKDKYEVTTDPNSLKLIEKDTDAVVVATSVISDSKIEIHQGNFYTCTGMLIEITPKHLRIGGITISENLSDGFGKAFELNNRTLSLFSRARKGLRHS